MRTSLNKKLYIFICSILLVGILVGIIFVIMLNESTKEIIFLNINEALQGINVNPINNILIHLLILSSIVILSIFIIGAPLIAFFAFYNGFSIGFIISNLTYIFGIKGFLYSLIYLIISKGIYILLLIVLNVSLLKLIKNIIDKIIYKKNNKDNLIVLSKKIILCLGIIFITDILIYFFGAKLINLFNFLIY